MSSPGNVGGGGGGGISTAALAANTIGAGIAQVSINESELFPSDYSALIVDDATDDNLAIWTDYQIMNKYEVNYHRWMLGITSPEGFDGGTAAFVQTAAPKLFWMSRWTACRISTAPTIPDPDAITDKNWILLATHYEPFSIRLMNDGITPIYRISGVFVYGYKNFNTKNVLNYMSYGRPAWIDSVVPRNVGVVTTHQGTNIIDSAQGSKVTGARQVSPGNPG
jgi:hypothetical protein